MPTLAELDRALLELQTDVTSLHGQLAQQRTEFRTQVTECARMAASDVASVKFARLGPREPVTALKAEVSKSSDRQVREILSDVAAFQQKLQEKTTTTNRLTSENERLRAALVQAQREKDATVDSLARLSAKYAELKAGLGVVPAPVIASPSEPPVHLPHLPQSDMMEVGVQTEIFVVEENPEELEPVRKSVFKAVRASALQQKAARPIPQQAITANPWAEESLELKGTKFGLEKTRPTPNSRATSIERLVPRPKSPVDVFSVAATKVRNYNIRDD